MACQPEAVLAGPTLLLTVGITPRYGEALQWAEQLHRQQRRKGKQVPYISHLISVSALVWEDGGSEDQAIAALLHDAIEDAGQTQASIAARFGELVAAIVQDCTDTSPAAPAGKKEPWLLRKSRFIASLAGKPLSSLLVAAADKAHNAGDMVLDAHRDPAMWGKFSAGLDGSAWYLLSMHQELKQRLPESRSVQRLGEAVRDILASNAYQELVPHGNTATDWALSYPQRHGPAGDPPGC